MRRPAALLAITAVVMTTTPAQAAPAPNYVALGDSYAAGPGIPTPKDLTPRSCGRSDHNYPTILATWLRATTFTDATCGGATTDHMTTPQQTPDGPNPPQLDALTPDTTLVTLTIGGNDIGFGEILETCGRLGATNPQGSPCRDHYTRTGTDELAARVRATAPKVATTLTAIHTRSPKAKIILVGYLRILPPTTGCWPQVPFTAKDTTYFDDIEGTLNDTLATTAHQAEVRFANPYPHSTHHDACAPADRRWVEPLQSTSPIHPNARGMTIVAGLTWLRTFLP